jgi:hypothetical protein
VIVFMVGSKRLRVREQRERDGVLTTMNYWCSRNSRSGQSTERSARLAVPTLPRPLGPVSNSRLLSSLIAAAIVDMPEVASLSHASPETLVPLSQTTSEDPAEVSWLDPRPYV